MAGTTQQYGATGLTCGHCVHAVTEELRALDGVEDVEVELVNGGTSVVTVTSSAELSDSQVAEALDEAGGYQLVTS
ncbi:MAG TPA: heavy-metal-associated domain-containing protein [Phycicoccus sp.]|nr:heavy-metal-associated domain-containing protein [Phycicoccus sp.]